MNHNAATIDDVEVGFIYMYNPLKDFISDHNGWYFSVEYRYQ